MSLVTATRAMAAAGLYAALDDKLRALLGEVAETARALGPVDDAEALIGGSDEQRRAWLSLPALVDRYAELRKAQHALDSLRPPERDRRGEYAELRSPTGEDEPADPRRRLLRLAAHPSSSLGSSAPASVTCAGLKQEHPHPRSDRNEPWLKTSSTRRLRWPRCGLESDRTGAFLRLLDLGTVAVTDDGRVDTATIARRVDAELKATPEFAAAGRAGGSTAEPATHPALSVSRPAASARRKRQAEQRPDPFAGMTVLGPP